MEFLDRESVDSENCDRKALEFLCGDLMEEIFDDDSYHLSCDFKTVKRKPGAKTSRKRASRKLKVRVNKISAKSEEFFGIAEVFATWLKLNS
jgi:hypothetical protein